MIKILLHNKVLKFFYAIILLPLCYVLLRTLFYVIVNLEFSNKIVQLFLLGCATYLFIHILLYKPIKLYIIGHELVHTISAYLCGIKVKKIKIGSSSGTVNVDKVNTFVALSPYFVPFYSFVIFILWVVTKFIFKVNISIEILSFALGFTIAFHLILTAYAIYIGQQDFQISGWLFSIVVVLILNCILLIFIFMVLTPVKVNVSEIKNFFISLTKQTYYNCYLGISKFLSYIVYSLKTKTKQ